LANPGYTEDQLQEAADAFAEHGRQYLAAAALGLKPNTYSSRLKAAAARGYVSRTPAPMPGFVITEHNVRTNAVGAVLQESTRQKPEPGPAFRVPKHQKIKGISNLSNGDGKTILRWEKTTEDDIDPVVVAEDIRKSFEIWRPKSPTILAPRDAYNDLLSNYITLDWHIGAFAWSKETEGPDWDLSIARKVLGGGLREIVEQTPKSGHAVVMGLGDLLHSDTFRNQTERSGNVLDVDSRYPKCLATCIDLLCDFVELVATKHSKVEVSLKEGNHDRASTVGMRYALLGGFRKSKHITIDDSPSPFYWKRFGVNLLGGTHGDRAKLPDFPMIMANRRREDWGETTTRHFHSGHIHHDHCKEIGGVKVYAHRAPVAQDAFHSAEGYLSGRSLNAYNYHLERGGRGHTEVEIR
jgi:hypothetical protein